MGEKKNKQRNSSYGRSSKSDEVLKNFADMMISIIKKADASKWKKGWLGGSGAIRGLPQNISGRTYSGGNSFFLMADVAEKGYKTPVYMTFHQAREQGLHVKAGEKSIPISKWSLSIKDENGNKISEEDYRQMSKEEQAKLTVRPFLRMFRVFNVDQTNLAEVNREKYDAIVARFRAPEEEVKDTKGMYVNEALDRMFREKAWYARIQYDKPSDRAFFRPSEDLIVLPMKEQFKTGTTPEEVYRDGMEYYSTALHEMAHSTGHESRLNRPFGYGGTKEYAHEELIAEMTSALVGSTMGFDRKILDNNAQYLNGWLGNLRRNPETITGIMSDVGKASDMIIEKIDEQRVALNQTPLKAGNLAGLDEELGAARQKGKTAEVLQGQWSKINAQYPFAVDDDRTRQIAKRIRQAEQIITVYNDNISAAYGEDFLFSEKAKTTIIPREVYSGREQLAQEIHEQPAVSGKEEQGTRATNNSEHEKNFTESVEAVQENKKRRSYSESSNKSDNILRTFADMMIKIIMNADDGKRKNGWLGLGGSFSGLPHNINGRTYSDSNSLFLMADTADKGYKAPVYMTSLQVREQGLHVKEGESPVPFLKWSLSVNSENGNRMSVDDYYLLPKEDRAKLTVYPFYKMFHVFNIDQTNLEEVDKKKYDAIIARFHNPVQESKDAKGMYANEVLDRMLDRMFGRMPWITMSQGDNPSDRAFYNPSRDITFFPMKSQFKRGSTPEEIYRDGMDYYSTALHVMAHRTGHKSRLDRYFGSKGTAADAHEQLVAEMSSAFVASIMGFDRKIPDSKARYLEGWINNLRNKPESVLSIMSDIGQASNRLICNIDIERDRLHQSPLVMGNMQGLDKELGETKKRGKTIPELNLQFDRIVSQQSATADGEMSEQIQKRIRQTKQIYGSYMANISDLYGEWPFGSEYEDKMVIPYSDYSGHERPTLEVQGKAVVLENVDETVLDMPEIRLEEVDSQMDSVWEVYEKEAAQDREFTYQNTVEGHVTEPLPGSKDTVSESGLSSTEYSLKGSSEEKTGARVVNNQAAEPEHVYWFESDKEASSYYQLHVSEQPSLKDAVFVLTGKEPTPEQIRKVLTDFPSATQHLAFSNVIENNQLVDRLTKEINGMVLSNAVVTAENRPYLDSIPSNRSFTGGDEDLLPEATGEKYGRFEAAWEEGMSMIRGGVSSEEDIKEQKELTARLFKDYHDSLRDFLGIPKDRDIQIVKESPAAFPRWSEQLQASQDSPKSNPVRPGIEKTSLAGVYDLPAGEYISRSTPVGQEPEKMPAVTQIPETQDEELSDDITENVTLSEDSNPETNVASVAEKIIEKGNIPKDAAEKQAAVIVEDQQAAIEEKKQKAEQAKQAALKKAEDERRREVEEQRRKEEENKQQEKDSGPSTKLLLHAALLLGALELAKGNKGIWMNKTGKNNAEFLGSKRPIMAYNNIMMNLQSDQKGYHTNIYIYYDKAKEMGAPVRNAEKALPFNWMRWDYQNIATKDIITKEEYNGLSEDEKQLYVKHGTRQAQQIFNIDQTLLTNRELYSALLKEQGIKYEELSERGVTNMMKFAEKLKRNHPTAIVLAHTEGQYQVYGKDAAKAGKVLGLPVGQTDVDGEKVKTVSFPQDRLDNYLPKLVQAKHWVVVADNLDSAALIRQMANEKEVLSRAYSTAQSVAKSAGIGYERVMVLQDAEYDRQKDKITVSGMTDRESGSSCQAAIEKANDIYRAVVAATGSEQRLDRMGRNNLLPKDDATYERFVQDLASGVLMARQGLPATLSKESMQRIDYLQREIRENPKLLGLLEKDVNNAVESIDKHLQKQVVRYEEIRNELTPKDLSVNPRQYSISTDLSKIPDMEAKEIVIVRDKAKGSADVILPEGASLEDDVEISGIRKDRIRSALGKEGITDVKFYNAGGGLGLNEPDDYYKDKTVSVDRLKQYEFARHRDVDVKSQIAASEMPRLKLFVPIKDDKGQYAFFFKPENEPSFAVYPNDTHKKLYFDVRGTDRQQEIHNALAQKYYAVAQRHPEVKADLVMPETPDVDMGRIERPTITRDKENPGRKYVMATVDGQFMKKEISKAQWDKMWLADDMSAYKKAVAAVMFAPLLKESVKEGNSVQHQEQATESPKQAKDEVKEDVKEESNDMSETTSEQPEEAPRKVNAFRRN